MKRKSLKEAFNSFKKQIEQSFKRNSIRQKEKQEKIKNLKNRLQPLINEANSRWEKLDVKNLRSTAISRALEENNNIKGFDISQLTSPNQIIAEATRARVFINDPTSTIRGASLYTRQESYKKYLGQFGNKYNNFENNFKRFNINIISEDEARIAFRAYRMLEETDAARIMAYGSENMIAAMYDLVIEKGLSDTEDAQDVAGYARKLLDNEMGTKKEQFEKAFQNANRVGDILELVKSENDWFSDTFW